MMSGQSTRPTHIWSLHGGGDMARKKTTLQVGKVTYGDKDPQEAFTEAFAPYFAQAAEQKQESKKVVGS